MPENTSSSVLSTYQHLFNKEPAFIVTAPGRINLIGEHTDYSEGFVLPVAINRQMTIALSPRLDRNLKIYSADFNETLESTLEGLNSQRSGWQAYISGMAWALAEAGYALQGWEGVIAGDIPIGAGLSSSAALEVAVAKAFCLTSGLDISPTQLALLSQKAENDWVGVKVGIMDQLISAAGKAKHAMLLDCRSLNFEHVPIPDQVSFMVLDTMTRRELTHSEYNTRQNEVQLVSERLGRQYLRDVNLDLLLQKSGEIPPVLFKRAHHVITENGRVHEFSNAMRNSQFKRMGVLINESHTSLRDDYEVSSRELNLIVDLAQNQPGCLGARMMGAGFGGCALALLRNGQIETFAEAIFNSYLRATGIEPNIFKVESSSGVSVKVIPD